MSIRNRLKRLEAAIPEEEERIVVLLDDDSVDPEVQKLRDRGVKGIVIRLADTGELIARD